ncbi:hypothetical protein Sgleb_02590 [Streptomyces glebosus]|uniref:Uncharacterized protein n=1 Tax=Streptomyces glebosus TaxID=249580 RepID=A0A640SN58_9ACTN|nr:hypothetical protein Sgleb_02590 [Streptomyces glebosus]GHG72497.1 hypothetical protein GCM10010513_45400 [Streptomyces glebosus]
MSPSCSGADSVTGRQWIQSSCAAEVGAKGGPAWDFRADSTNAGNFLLSSYFYSNVSLIRGGIHESATWPKTAGRLSVDAGSARAVVERMR